jgi:hypothetical protein
MQIINLPEQLASKILFGPACWEWVGAKVPHGYGYVNWKGVVQPAHRVVYEFCVSPIPGGLDIDHLCRNRRCVNPEHLEPVTRAVNLNRSPIGQAAKSLLRTHCKWGHPVGPKKVCRPCANRNNRAWESRKKAFLAEHLNGGNK